MNETTNNHAVILVLLIIGLIISLAILIVVEIPKANREGFGQGYVCAFNNEQEKHADYIVYETEKSEYCKKFSKLFDEAMREMVK